MPAFLVLPQTIDSKRLVLRKLRKGDERRIFELLTERVVRFLESVPWPYSKRHAEEFVLRSMDRFGREYTYAITLEDELIGLVTLDRIFRGRASLGYWLGEDYWGNGYATEAVRALLDAARGDLRLAVSTASTRNIASQRVLEKCGFTKLGRIPLYYKSSLGELQDVYCYYRLL